MLAPYLIEALGRTPADEGKLLSGYDEARKREFGGKWKLERIVGMAIAYPYFMNNVLPVSTLPFGAAWNIARIRNNTFMFTSHLG